MVVIHCRYGFGMKAAILRKMKKYTFLNSTAFILRLLAIAVCLNLSGCALLNVLDRKGGNEEDPEIDETETAEKLYKEAHASLFAKQDFTTAIEKFELLEARYPFGKYAQQAQLELSYAYYKQNNIEQALNTVNRFIKLNPQHPSIDYAHYIKGLITFDSGKNLIHYVLPRDPSNNDPTSLHEAFKTFSLLVEEYPDSKYADDAKLRMIYLRNELAEYELKVAKFYMRRGAYVAAANRAQYILENYQGAEIMPEAVYMLEQAYVQLGIDDLAEDTHRVYAQNFPTRKDGEIKEKFTSKNRSCAQGTWSRVLEKLRLKTYYCN